MRRGIWLLIAIILIALLFPFAQKARAESSYVLPYPSAMPGNFFYKIRILEEKIQYLWSFGSFSKFKYNQKYADKYLVEAKTLFEYKQYLLAIRALDKSDYFFSQMPKALSESVMQKKDITEKKDLFKKQSEKHIEILTSLNQILPETFLWQPESGNSEILLLREQISKSNLIRKKAL